MTMSVTPGSRSGIHRDRGAVPSATLSIASAEVLQSLGQLPDRHRQPIRNCLNGKQRRVFDTPLNPAQECPVEVGFGSESLLGEFSLLPQSSNPCAEPFGNVVSHASLVVRSPGIGCRL